MACTGRAMIVSDKEARSMNHSIKMTKVPGSHPW